MSNLVIAFSQGSGGKWNSESEFKCRPTIERGVQELNIAVVGSELSADHAEAAPFLPCGNCARRCLDEDVGSELGRNPRAVIGERDMNHLLEVRAGGRAQGCPDVDL